MLPPHIITQLIDILMQNGTLEKGSTIFDNSDGCAKQCQCGASLNLLSMLAETHNIKIDRAVSAPGHGKGMVDTQNGGEKTTLNLACRRNFRAGESSDAPGQDVKIDPSHVKDGKFVDPADVAFKLLKEQRATNARGRIKNQKKVAKALIKRRECHIRKWFDP